MSFKTSDQQAALLSTSRYTNPTAIPVTAAAPTWVRNPSWLAMPTVLATEQKIVSLYAIYPDNSSVAVTISGSYQVNWGDGSAVSNVSSATSITKNYDYNNAALDGTNAPVTFTASTSTVNRTSHGYTNGMTVEFYNIVTTTGITEGISYYVINATADTFQISTSNGGTPVALTGDGSATLLPYKQAIITITPQAGNNLTSVNLNILPTSKSGFSGSYLVSHLDMIFSGTNISTFVLGASSPVVSFRMLERAQFISTNLVGSWSFAFANCTKLQSVPIWRIRNDTAVTANSMFANSGITVAPELDTSRVTTTATMFSGCVNLVSVPAYDLSNATALNNMFTSCVLLRSVPAFKLSSSITTVANMFQNCPELTNVPDMNLSTSTLTSVISMFQSCSKLTVAPNIKLPTTGSGVAAGGMFQNCVSLTKIPEYELSKVTDAGSMFSGCVNLASLPWTTINLPACTNASSMFGSCAALVTIPDINFGTGVTTLSNTFSSCTGVKTIGTLTLPTTSNINISSAFQNCNALQYVNIVNTGSITVVTSAFNGCVALLSVRFSGPTNIATMSSAMFNLCYSLVSHTPLTISSSFTGFTNPYSTGCGGNLRKGGLGGFTNALTIGPITNPVSDFNTNYMDTVGKATAQASTFLTITGCSASGLVTTNVVASGTTGTVSSTASLAVGMYIGLVYNGTSVAITKMTSVDVTTGIFTFNSHGYSNGDKVGIGNVGTITNLAISTQYFVINATADTFQLSTTQGGSAISLTGTNSTTTTVVYPRYIKSIDSATTFTYSGPAVTAASASWNFHVADVRTPIIRGWNIIG